jgi:hypothetical protein
MLGIRERACSDPVPESGERSLPVEAGRILASAVVVILSVVSLRWACKMDNYVTVEETVR